jgi:hypothetical protein
VGIDDARIDDARINASIGDGEIDHTWIDDADPLINSTFEAADL